MCLFSICRGHSLDLSGLSSISRVALPVSTDTKSVRDKLVYLWFLVVFVPCAAAAARHAAAAIPCYCHCLFALDVHVMAGNGIAAARAAPSSRGCWKCGRSRPRMGSAGPVPAGAWPRPASGLAPRSPAPGRSLVPLAGNAAGLRYRGSGGYRHICTAPVHRYNVMYRPVIQCNDRCILWHAMKTTCQMITVEARVCYGNVMRRLGDT